jgi:Macrophage migration inhibitory factor (MIF)
LSHISGVYLLHRQNAANRLSHYERQGTRLRYCLPQLFYIHDNPPIQIEDAQAFITELSKVRVSKKRERTATNRCITQFSAETLGRPESHISVSYTYNEMLSFSGTLEPAFLLDVVSLQLPPKRAHALIVKLMLQQSQANATYAKSFFGFFKNRLGVEGDRGSMCVFLSRPFPSPAMECSMPPHAERSPTLAMQTWRKYSQKLSDPLVEF